MNAMISCTKVSSPAEIGRAIVLAGCAEHLVDEATLRGPTRTLDVVGARIQIALQLRSAGFSTAAIGRLINRDPTVVSSYFNSHGRQKNRDRGRLIRQMRYLPDDVLALIGEFAKAENVPSWMIVREWIVERAKYEIEAKARAERGAA